MIPWDNDESKIMDFMNLKLNRNIQHPFPNFISRIVISSMHDFLKKKKKSNHFQGTNLLSPKKNEIKCNERRVFGFFFSLANSLRKQNNTHALLNFAFGEHSDESKG